MAINFNELSTTAPIPQSDDMDKKMSFPNYNDMTKHKYLYAYKNDDGDVYSDESVKDFNKSGDHTWTPGRKCIVYTRIHNDTG